MIGHPDVTVEPDAASVADRAAAHIAERIVTALAQRGAAHIALPGGRTPVATLSRLGPLIADWTGVHLWCTDERCVPPDDPESNARLIRRTLNAPGAMFHQVDGLLGPVAAARAYERELGDVVLDVAVLGLGEDGHTASLFPDDPALSAEGRVAPVTGSPKPPSDRVTLTVPCLNGARDRLLIVTGGAKAGALTAALAAPSAHVPASLLNGAGTSVIADAAATDEPSMPTSCAPS